MASTTGPIPRRDDLLTVQALRAIAALLVVAYHALDAWGTGVAGRSADALWANGAAGVDIFFVISGLVMTISTARIVDRPHPAWAFMRQRLTRIMPLYWVATTAKIAAVLALPMLVERTRLDAAYIAGSYALLPVQDWTGAFRPVLPVGWTLTYEMLFYLLVAAALALRVPILRIALPALAVFAAASFIAPGFANTIVIEFLYGVGIGMLWHAARGSDPVRVRLPQPGKPSPGRRDGALPPEQRAGVRVRGLVVPACLLAGGFVAILLLPVGSGALRPLTWGLPAACIVGGAIALEPVLRTRLPRWLLGAGDASYAVYLTHGFVVPLVFLLADVAGLTAWASLIVTIGGSLLVSLAVGHFAHIWLERPMLHWFRRRRSAASPVPAAG